MGMGIAGMHALDRSDRGGVCSGTTPSARRSIAAGRPASPAVAGAA